MEGTAVFWRRIFGQIISRKLARHCAPMLALTFLASCVAGSSSPTSSSDAANTQEQDVSASLVADSVGAPAGSQELAPAVVLSSQNSGDLGIELVKGPSSSQLVLNSSAKAGDFAVNRLSNPDRLVIDIKGQISSSNRSFDTSDTQLVDRVRVGAHPDMTRVVLDLTAGRNIEHAIESQDGRMLISLNAASAGSPELSEPVEVTAASDIAPADSATAPEAQLVKDEPVADAPKASPDLTSPEIADSNIAASKIATNVENVVIEQLSPSTNMVVADVTSAGEYSLEKTAPSEYVLRLKDASLGANVVSSVASQKTGLIRSVRPTAQGDDVLIRIFAQPGSRLNARASSDKIVVSAVSETDLQSADMRAQAAPEKVEPKAEQVAAKPGAGSPEVTLGADSAASDSVDKELELLAAQKYSGRQISLDLQDTDIDNALRIIAEVSNLNIIASDDVTGKVTLRLIDVPWDQALDVILKTNGLDSVREGNVIRIAPIEKLRQEREAIKALKQQEDELEALQVKYIRISYAKASELKPLVETVVSERGVVSYDERSNQIIVKDINAGIKNVSELISRVDLRTPQVLLETQIVEASRSLARDLGAELGFEYIQSPATGNATGANFPNTIGVSGSVTGAQGVASSFPAGTGPSAGSAISLLLGSADGSKSLDLRISSLESEGRARVVSRPAVATTNNKQATIKSVEKIRVKTPQGGLSVATGQGASASGASAVATEAIEIGITLEVTPQASPDYYVLLDINAKSSTFGAHPVDGIPSEVERSATSTVLVSSGQTFAMGGIYKLTDGDTVQGVPFLKDVPVFGHLFRHTSINNGDEELLFFITPRIVEGSFDDATMKVSS